MRYPTLESMALHLPAVETSTSYGTPALKVKGKLMVRLREDGETVVFRTTWDRREELMTLHPDICFVTDHYRAHPWVLATLSKLTDALAASLLDEAWREVATRTLMKTREAAATRAVIDGKVLAGHKQAAVEVPFDPQERWRMPARPIRKGRRGHAVRARLEGHAFDTVIVPRSKRFWLILEDETLSATGIAVGDEVKIDLEPVATAV